MHEGLEIITGKEFLGSRKSHRDRYPRNTAHNKEGRKKQNKKHTRKHSVVLLVRQGQLARDLIWKIPS